jgi:lipopolysaccharide heptosyltransferase II
VKLADLGDALTATPALRALRQSWPSATIDVLTSPAGAAAMAGLDSVDRLWIADKHRFDSPAGLLAPSALGGLAPLLGRLRHERYDRLLLLHHLTTLFGTLKYALLAAIVHARQTIGLDNGRGWFLDTRVPDAGFGDLHEVDYNLAVTSAAGASRPERPQLEIAVDAPAEQRAHELLAGSDWIALHAGGGTYSLARRWPAECFAEVGRKLAVSTGSRLVLVGAEDDRGPHALLARELHALDLTGLTAVKETAAVLRRCRLLVSNDSGVVHLAAAAGTPVVAIFGPSNARAWGPYPVAQHRVVRVSLPCSPCFYRGQRLGTPQGCATRDCLQLITPDMVLAAAGELLAAAPA